MDNNERQRIADVKEEIELLSVRKSWYRAYLANNVLSQEERAKKKQRLETLIAQQDELVCELLYLTHPLPN